MALHRHRHDPSKNLVGFIVGDVEYAVAIERVREIANPLEVVPLPHAPESVVGVADYRGEVVPVVDLRMRFGLIAAELTRKTKWIVIDVRDRLSPRGVADESTVRHDGRLVALVVDSVTEVFGTGGADMRPAPSLGGGGATRGIGAVTTHGKALVFVLDAARLRELTEPLAAAGRIGSEASVHSLSAGPTT
ncbi:MAG: chemotaxis protein CheW [Myxococcota bacterium]|nr:chemotaxis protein CheW [Myxococcota bacterium]